MLNKEFPSKRNETTTQVLECYLLRSCRPFFLSTSLFDIRLFALLPSSWSLITGSSFSTCHPSGTYCVEFVS
jgi:hypothetical protein